VSTPDRTVTDPDRPLGPPTDPRDRRAWSRDQFELLLHSTGFDVERTWRVPSGPPLLSQLVRARSLASVGGAVRRRRGGLVFLVRRRAS
jgi:hypothetical protein